MENGPGLKMYFLLKMGICHCYVSLLEGTPLERGANVDQNGQRIIKASKVRRVFLVLTKLIDGSRRRDGCWWCFLMFADLFLCKNFRLKPDCVYIYT